MLNDREVDVIFTEVSKRVTVACDEMHAHSAIQGCLSGKPEDITILMLVETIRYQHRVLKEAYAKVMESHP
jgi:hypothetical protein